MFKALKSFLSFFLISNIYIALGATALCLEVYYLSTGTLSTQWDYGLFIFFGTLALYNAHRYISYNRSRIVGRADRFTIVAELNIWVPILVIIAALSSVLYGWSYVQSHSAALVTASVLSILYITPVFFGKRLRDIGWLKLPVLATVFTILTAWIPAQIFSLPEQVVYWLCAQRFMFLIAITIPFEIRDQDIDKSSQVQTIVHFLGAPRSKRLSILLLLLTMLVGTQLMDLGYYDLPTLLASIGVLVLSGLLVIKSPAEEKIFYYLGALDGMLILHALAIILIHLQPA